MMLVGGDEYRLKLASVPRKLRPALTKELGGVASQVIVPEMKRRSTVFSTRIPKSITVSVRYGFSTAGVYIRQSPRIAPHGPINEGGGRHPVFGNREVWVYQEPRPYFYISARGKTRELREAGNRAIDTALQGL